MKRVLLSGLAATALLAFPLVASSAQAACGANGACAGAGAPRSAHMGAPSRSMGGAPRPGGQIGMRDHGHGGGYRPDGGGYHGGNFGAAAAGLAAGAVVGGVIAGATQPYPYYGYGQGGGYSDPQYDPQYTYGDPQPPYYGAPVQQDVPPQVAVGDADAESYCVRTFRSYDPSSGTYLGYDGQRHYCP